MYIRNIKAAIGIIILYGKLTKMDGLTLNLVLNQIKYPNHAIARHEFCTNPVRLVEVRAN